MKLRVNAEPYCSECYGEGVVYEGLLSTTLYCDCITRQIPDALKDDPMLEVEVVEGYQQGWPYEESDEDPTVDDRPDLPPFGAA